MFGHDSPGSTSMRRLGDDILNNLTETFLSSFGSYCAVLMYSVIIAATERVCDLGPLGILKAFGSLLRPLRTF